MLDYHKIYKPHKLSVKQEPFLFVHLAAALFLCLGMYPKIIT